MAAYVPRYPTFAALLGSGLHVPRIPANRLTSRVSSAVAGLPPLTYSGMAAPADTAGGTPPPGYGDLLNLLTAGLGGAPTGAITPEEGLAQARRALVQYGGVPAGLSGLHNLGGAFDKGTSALANANTTSGISILARLNQAHADQNRYIKNRLAAHGIIGSGETGFQLGREQTNFARGQADSASKLLDYLSGINAGIASYQQWQAMMDALRGLMSGGGGGGDTGGGAITSGGGTSSTGETWHSGNNDYGSYSGGKRYDYLRQARGGRNVYF